MLRQITLVCVDAGGGHACGLAQGLKKHGQLKVVWENRNKHRLDYMTPDAKYGYKHIYPSGDDLIIVSCITYDHMKEQLDKVFRNILNSYQRIHVVITDGRYARNPDYYNQEFKGFDVLTTGCKRHFREPLPVKTYYQPFDLSLFSLNKNKDLTISHSPFVKSKYKEKGTLEIIDSTNGYNLDLITGLSWKACIERKARSHIFVDQIDHYDRDKFKFKSPDYVWPALGKSGIEAMHLGCLVITYGAEQKTEIPSPPVAWCNGNFKEILDYYIKNERERIEMAMAAREWALKYASYDFAAQNVLR